jgi:hypothetical protein
VDDAARCKELGAEAHKHKELQRATKLYERALYHVDFDEATWALEVLQYAHGNISLHDDLNSSWKNITMLSMPSDFQVHV